MAQGWSKQCSAAHSGPVTHGPNLCYYLNIAAGRGGAGVELHREETLRRCEVCGPGRGGAGGDIKQHPGRGASHCESDHHGDSSSSAWSAWRMRPGTWCPPWTRSSAGAPPWPRSRAATSPPGSGGRAASGTRSWSRDRGRHVGDV